jgi:hypothetical protein
MQGNDGEGEALVKVDGDCNYTPPGAPDLGTQGGLKPGWYCHSYVYRVDSGVRKKSVNDPTPVPAYENIGLPAFIGQDVRGYTDGKPELRLESARELVLDDFGIIGLGQLRFSCPTDIANGLGLKGCRISWRHKWMPETLYFHGTCGESVVVPGIYVSVGE